MILRYRHVLLIGLAATIGVVVGYVLVAGSGKSDQHPVASDASNTASVAQQAAGQQPPGDGAIVPDVQGQRLPEAENQLTARGFRKLQEVDATPQGRLIVEKANWVVDTQTPVGGTAAGLDTIIVLKLKKETDDSSPAQTPKGVVPNVVCAELQAAQDALRASGFFVLTSQDGSGQGRLALLDRNWVVIAQSVPPGTSPALTTHIVLTVVKHGEPTGDSGCRS